ncbi:MAG: cytosol aminopeptidase [Myxococcaceae bacterium]|nr:cytosol aminopeptidase [Myxococcaceae bacterium]
MEVRFVPLDLARIDLLRMEVLALPFFADERPLKGTAGLCDWRLCGALSRILVGGRVTGAADEVTMVPGRPRLPFEKIILFGEGEAADFDAAAAERVTARLLMTLAGLRLRSVALSLPGRGAGRVGAGEAMRWFLQSLAESDELDEVVIVDDVEAQRAMVPVLEAARRRVRVVRSASEP